MVHSYPASCPWEETQSEGGAFVLPELGLGICETAAMYRPRHPEESVLFAVLAEHLETFLVRQRERERLVPRFVERELRSFLGGTSWVLDQ